MHMRHSMHSESLTGTLDNKFSQQYSMLYIDDLPSTVVCFIALIEMLSTRFFLARAMRAKKISQVALLNLKDSGIACRWILLINCDADKKLEYCNGVLHDGC